jgi:hypothetical protein
MSLREPKSNSNTTTFQNAQFAIRQHAPGGIDHALRHGSKLKSSSQVSTPCFPSPRPDRAASSSAFTDTYIVPYDMIRGIKSNLKKPAFPGIRHGTVRYPLRRSGVYGVHGFRDAEHDVLLAMMRWVEQGVAPDQIIATTRYHPRYSSETETALYVSQEAEVPRWGCGQSLELVVRLIMIRSVLVDAARPTTRAR